MEEITGFDMKNSLTLPSLAKKCFNSLLDENDESIYTYTDQFTKIFVQNSNKRRICNAFNHHYKSAISDEVSRIFQKN